MPYDASNVPSYVPKEHAAQFAAIWNSRYEAQIKAGKTKDEAEESAFRVANGVLKKEAFEADTVGAEILGPAGQMQPPQAADVQSVINPQANPSGPIPSPVASLPYEDQQARVFSSPGPDPVVREADMPDPLQPPVGVGPMMLTPDTKPEDAPVRVVTSEETMNHPFAILLSMNAAVTAIDGKPTVKIPVAVTGSWVKRGNRFAITPNNLQEIVSNFQKRKNEQVVIDHDHASENPEVARGGPIPAAGWIHNLYVEGNQLVANVEWTPDTADMIRKGQYRFFSPSLDWGRCDKETGEPQGCTLTSGAVTNQPFLEELPPLMLSDPSMEAVSNMDVGQVHVDAPLGEVSVAVNQPETTESASEKMDTDSTKNSETMAEVTKSEGDGNHPSSHYLVVEDAAHPTSWHLRVKDASGKLDHGLMGAAWAALHKGYRGNDYQGPDKQAAISKLTGLYKSEGMETPKALSEGKPMKSKLAKIEKGKFAGRTGRFNDKGVCMNVMPADMSEEQMSAYCAELDDADPAAGTAQPGPTHGEPSEAVQEPAGALLSEPERVTVEQVSDAQLLAMITYPAGHAKAGRVNLAEAQRLVKDKTITSDQAFAARNAEDLVTQAIVEEHKFLPKQRASLMRQALSDAAGFQELVDSQPVITVLAKDSYGMSGHESIEDRPADAIMAATKVNMSEQGSAKDYRQALIDATRTPEGAKLWERHRLSFPNGTVDGSLSAVQVTRD